MFSCRRIVMGALRKGFSPSQIITFVELARALRGCRSVLDVGCGANSCLSQFGFDRLVGLEGYAPSVEQARLNRTHHEVQIGDVRTLDQRFSPGQFDACVAIDVIEHLTPEEGLKLAAAMELVAARRSVIVTPNGFLPQGHADQTDLQEHHSGWEPAQMRRLGYRVIGLLGPKGLRGEYHKLKCRPESFWGVVSLLGQLCWTRWLPRHSAAILCVKGR